MKKTMSINGNKIAFEDPAAPPPPPPRGRPLPRTDYERIDPETAELYLEFNKVNRPLKPSIVEKYARDMKAGNWLLTHEAIGFDWNEELCDGQHRLKAIIMSGVTLTLPVCRGLPPESKQAMDQGEKRSAVDRLAFEGVKVKQRDLAVAKIFLNYKRKSFTHSEVIDSYYRHQEAIKFATSIFPHSKSRLTTAGTLTPIARAYYLHDRAKIAHFASVLYDGIGGEEERIIIALRDFLTRLKTASGEIQIEIYLKTERALYAYLHGEKITNLLMATRELFPLPDDEGPVISPEEDAARLFEGLGTYKN